MDYFKTGSDEVSLMNRTLLIATAMAAVLAGRAVAEQVDQPIDEKCYGVSPHDVSECGGDPQTCARMTSMDSAKAPGTKAPAEKPGEVWAYVPKGTCVKIYHGSLSEKSS